MARFTVVLFGILILIVTFSLADIPESQAQTSDIGYEVHENNVVNDFPEQLTFRFVAEVDEPVQRAELHFRISDQSNIQVRREAIQGQAELDLSVEIDSQITYLPPGVDIEYWWSLTLDSGAIVETDAETYFYIDDGERWSTVENEYLRIYYSGGNTSFGNEALNTTSNTYESLIDQFNLDSIEQTRMVLYNSSERFQQALPNSSPEWIGGFADPDINLIVAGIDPGPGASREIGRMLTHEAVHIIVHQATDNPFTEPATWLDEGLAVYYQDVEDLRFQPLVDEAVESGRLIPLPVLNSGFPNDSDLALQSYAQSESIVRFILTTRGASAIADLFIAYQSGLSHEQASQQALGMTLDELDAEWKAWLGYPGDDDDGGWADGLPSTNGAVNQIERQLATTAPYLVLGVAAIGVVIAGIRIMIHKTRDEEDEYPEDDPDSEDNSHIEFHNAHQ